MAITTYATFATALRAMTVTGVTRSIGYPPAALNSSDLPAMWVQMPRGDEGAMTFEYGGGWPTLTADVLIALEAAAQDRQQQNYELVETMMDALAAALRALDTTKAPLNWTIRQAGIVIGAVSYWGVVATVNGKG